MSFRRGFSWGVMATSRRLPLIELVALWAALMFCLLIRTIGRAIHVLVLETRVAYLQERVNQHRRRRHV